MSVMKKFKKLIQIFVPTADKDNHLKLEPGTKGFVIIHASEKVGVSIKDLEEALVEVRTMHELYYPDAKKEDTEEEILNQPIKDYDVDDFIK